MNPGTNNHYRNPLYIVLAALIVGLLFFDVLFLNASLQPSNIVAHVGKPDDLRYSSLKDPVAFNRSPGHGFSDLGSTSWQGEPARYFMARTFENNDSPYWNPYSANGSLGPDTLVDLKFSPVTLLITFFFGATAESWDFGLLCMLLIGVFCIYKTSHQFFRLSAIASLYAAVFYLLNGFAITNINSQNAQAYFLAPIVLLTLVQWSRSPSLTNWLWLALSHTVIFLVSMLPITALCLITCHLINLAYGYKLINNNQLLFKNWGLLYAAVLYGITITAFLWIPTIDNFSVTTLFGDYGDRQNLLPYHWHNLISVIAPHHFWENYNGIRPSDILQQEKIKHDYNLLAHLGLGSLFFASALISRTYWRASTNKWLLATLIVVALTPYFRIFGLLPIFDHLPVFEYINRQYWGSMSSIGFCFLAAFGIDAIINKKAGFIAPLLTLAFTAFLLLYLSSSLEELWEHYLYGHHLKWLLFFLITYTSLFFFSKLPSPARPVFIALFVVMAILELYSYVNTLRPMRFQATDNPPEHIKFLQENIGDYRIFNIGDRGTLPPEFGTMYGIRQLSTHNAGLLPWYQSFYDNAFYSQSSLFLNLANRALKREFSPDEQVFNKKALNVASAKYIIVHRQAKGYKTFADKHYKKVFEKRPVTIYQNNHARPIFYLSNHWERSDNFDNIKDKSSIITQDEKLIALLEKHQINQTPECSNIKLRSYKNTEIIYEVDCDHPTLLATSDTWHPGWRAAIGDQSAYVGMINQAFRAVLIPAGKHTVRLYYAPSSITIGKTVTLLAITVLLALFLYGWSNNKTGRDDEYQNPPLNQTGNLVFTLGALLLVCLIYSYGKTYLFSGSQDKWEQVLSSQDASASWQFSNNHKTITVHSGAETPAPEKRSSRPQWHPADFAHYKYICPFKLTGKEHRLSGWWYWNKPKNKVVLLPAPSLLGKVLKPYWSRPDKILWLEESENAMSRQLAKTLGGHDALKEFATGCQIRAN